LEDYVNTKTNILVRHNSTICNNHVYSVKPSNFLNKSRCNHPKCVASRISTNRKKTIGNKKIRNTVMFNEEFTARVYELVGDEYTFLEDYVNTKTNILVRHNSTICNNHVYSVSPNKFLMNRRCNHPKCVASRISTHSKINIKNKPIIPTKTNEIFIKDVYELVGDEYTFLEDYVNNNIKLKIIHNTCKNEYSVTPVSFLSNRRRCPLCSKKYKNISRAELELEAIFNKYKIPFSKQIMFESLSKSLAYDFGVEIKDNFLILLEYDGIQHFRGWEGNIKNLKDQQRRDLTKNNFAKKIKIPLVRIAYTERNNLEYVVCKLLKCFERSTTTQNGVLTKLMSEEIEGVQIIV